MNQAYILLVPVLLPLLAGILLPVLPPLREKRARRLWLLGALVLNLLVTVMVLLRPDCRLTVLSLGERLPILLRLDDLSRLFCALGSAMFLLVGIYATDYMDHARDEGRFFSFYLIVLGMLMGIGLSGNFLTLYLFFEAMSLLSVPLVLHEMTREAIGAAFKYLFYSIAGASLALIGFFFIHTYGFTLEFTPGGVLDPARLAGNEGLMRVVSLATIVGFGAKAGMFPLHAWLPAAHPVAPAPASAVLSGVITKAGVFCIFRFVLHLVGADFLRGSWVQYAWMGIALLTVLMGSMLAFREPLLKKRFAYSSISQVSYIIFGFSTLTATGVMGGLLHMVVHSLAKDGLFLFAGAFMMRTGKNAVRDLRGIGARMPVSLGCFALIAVCVVGIPPTGGFLSKWYLATGSLVAGTGFLSWLGPVVLLLSALLTAGYLFPIAIHGFYPGADFQPEGERCEAGPRMLVPIILLTAAAVLLGVVPGALTGFLDKLVGAAL